MSRLSIIAVAAAAAVTTVALWPAPEAPTPTPSPVRAEAPASKARAEPDPPPSAATVLATVRGASPQLSDRALWDARRRLEATPSFAADLAETALHPETSDDGRALALDLLAHQGGEAAQVALAEVLLDPRFAARAGQQRGLLVQRAGFVTAPGPGLVAAVRQLAEAPDAEIRRAALAAAGGTARHLAASGAEAEAEGLLDDTARRGGDAADLEARVLGLGNGARPADQARLLAFASDGRRAIRRAAIRGLRHYEGEVVAERLAAAAADADRAIQRAALRGLTQRGSVSAAVLRQLGDAVRQARLHRTQDALLVTVLARHAARPEARAGLEAVLARAEDDAALRARIRGILRAGG